MKEDNKIQVYQDALRKAVKKITELNSQIECMCREQEIAIIGYDCCFPGGANSPEQYWDLLSKGYDAISEIPKTRFDVDKYYNDEAGTKGKTYTKNAGFLDMDIKSFDNTHFEITADEVCSMDPQQRILLETSWKALENSGLDIPKMRGSKTGVFIGLSSFEYTNAEIASGDANKITPYSLFGTSLNGAAGRISYYFDFKGPAVTIDTACSSALVALNTAIDSLKSRQCDLAIVGAANLILHEAVFISLSQIQALSPDGRCKVFDERADGFGRGEGCGVILLKRSDDAKKDGNSIEAYIRSSIIGQDGKANGFYAPNGLSETNVMKNALMMSGKSVDDIDYIEAHGTGTILGDYIEAQAIDEVYKNKKNPIVVGSVKSNIGHLEAAAGMAGLIKVLLSMKNGKIPPCANFKKTNQNINTERIRIANELIDWKKEEGGRCAGISSFGISGTLAHVILEEAEQECKALDLNVLPSTILTLSAQNKAALRRYLFDMSEYMKNTPCKYTDISYTTNINRSNLLYRFAVVGADSTDFIKKLDRALENKDYFDFNTSYIRKFSDKVAFLFTGQGSIYHNIARQLFDYSEVFRKEMMTCNIMFSEKLGISIVDAMYKYDSDKLSQPLYSQPVIFSVEYSLAKTWSNMGIKPVLVIGHSIGEIAAGCYSGVFSLEDAVTLVSIRAKLMHSTDIQGKMVGIMSNEESVRKAIKKSGCENVYIATINAPRNVTISGLENEVDKVIEVLQQDNRVFVNDLGINRPYHSKIMKSLEMKYEKELEEITFNKPQITMISSMYGKTDSSDAFTSKKYWTSQLSETVNYYDSINIAYDTGLRTFIEIGGNATLCGLSEQCLGNTEALFVPSLRKGVDSYEQMMESVKDIYLHGIKVDWNRVHTGFMKQKINIPNYPFKKKRLWAGI